MIRLDVRINLNSDEPSDLSVLLERVKKQAEARLGKNRLEPSEYKPSAWGWAVHDKNDRPIGWVELEVID